jgi:hypothetical protein
MAMTTDAKQALKETVRSLRARLLADLHDATESQWQLGVRVQNADLDEATRATRATFEAWAAEQVRTQVAPAAPTRVKRAKRAKQARRRSAAPDAAVDAEATTSDSSGTSSTGSSPSSTSSSSDASTTATAVAASSRASRSTGGERTADDFRREAEKLAAATLLNRLVMLRLLEAPGPDGQPAMRSPAVVTGGWESRGYKDFRELAPALVRGDATEGFEFLLRLVYADLAMELPGLYGDAGVADLVPIPPATLRHVIEALDDPRLESCWTDDMTLGWVYQYWNDPEREALDAKINAGGKIEPHEIASKTQLFTERYMVDWLLQNSLGPMWLAICKKHGWTPEVEADGTLANLEARRVEWRAKRDSGEVSLTDLMPLHTEAERRWAYYVPQPLSDDAVAKAAESVRDLKVIDPAVGSGHFLVVAVGLLWALYREEARHRGKADDPEWTDRAIIERILEYNLHGIDIDPRAVQIAAAALWFAGRTISRDARPARLNLVAANLRLASLPDDDPSLVKLRAEVERDIGMPGDLVDSIIHALRGADSLGSLLRIDRALDDAIAQHEKAMQDRPADFQKGLFGDEPKPARQARIEFDATAARRSLLDRLESFLTRHTGSDDLGLRLAGEQLAAGVRFVRMVREGAYDLVVANPPYQGTSKMAEAKYIEQQYPLGKADLYAAFLLRGLELVREGGVSAMLTMRNWMFIQQYSALRSRMLGDHSVAAIGDFGTGAFDDVHNDLLSVAGGVIQRCAPSGTTGIAIQPVPPGVPEYDRERTPRKYAAVLTHVGTFGYCTDDFRKVPDSPAIYWWSRTRLEEYARCEKLGANSPGKFGINLGSNVRFTLLPWEAPANSFASVPVDSLTAPDAAEHEFARYLMGAKGVEWYDAVDNVVRWRNRGLEVKLFAEHRYGSYTRKVTNEAFFFRPGVAFVTVGARFAARLHRWKCVIDGSGSSVYPQDVWQTLLLLNSSFARDVLQSLNPTISFTVGDVNRLPLRRIDCAGDISRIIEGRFSVHESHREPSVEFRQPGPSPWRHAQEWAQLAVDRPEGDPLPEYIEELDPEPATDHLSFALGVALGRFGPNGEGILDPATADLAHALPGGILFLDRTLDGDGTRDRHDSLFHAACKPLHEVWAAHADEIGTTRRTLRDWLALDFFGDVHKGMYENRPIHWPLSSTSKTFVAWVNIHRFTDRTLRLLLADHLVPRLTQIEGELSDLRTARDGADKKAAREADDRIGKLIKARDELAAFTKAVEACADVGPPPTDTACPAREQDARYAPNLDDGVMVNSAALWPLLEPQWRDPKKWWKELAQAAGRKDYDWSHLAMRYWPTRVDAKCQEDPSLAVAHGCFWRYHPARAWAWELRLQQEIGPDFRITEAPYTPGGRDVAEPADHGDAPHRAAWLRDNAEEALAAVEKEAERRQGRAKRRATVPEMTLLEPGLWTAMPAEVWRMEMRLSERQGAEFRLTAPDEPATRAAYAEAHPELARARAAALAQLKPVAEMFAEDDEDEDGIDGDGDAVDADDTPDEEGSDDD